MTEVGIPADLLAYWIPAGTGMTEVDIPADSLAYWIPAGAGMTDGSRRGDAAQPECRRN